MCSNWQTSWSLVDRREDELVEEEEPVPVCTYVNLHQELNKL